MQSEYFGLTKYIVQIRISITNESTQIKTLNDREYNISTEQIHCLGNNVIYRLFAATNQSINDQREQTLHLDTSQLALNQDPIVRQW